jgi:hypothetical protein
MALPVMTPEMRELALAKAAAARKERSAALGELTAGKLQLTAVLDGEEPRLQRAYVRQVLCALPGVGKVTTEKAMAEVGIDHDRRVKGLGPRQRTALAEHFAA